jgi:hypothetical protein
VIDRLTGPLAPKLADLAGQAIDAGTSVATPSAATYTNAVKAKADELRSQHPE